MRRLLLTPLLLTLALAGCRSDRPTRDYRSVNRTSLEFLKEAARSGNKLRRQNLRDSLRFSDRVARNRREQKAGMRFASQTFIRDEKANAAQALRGMRNELHFDRHEFGKSARFGFLDSGE